METCQSWSGAPPGEKGDQVVEQERLKVMLVDREMFVSLDGGTLSVESPAEGDRLSLSIE